jgi:hypothetical protein
LLFHTVKPVNVITLDIMLSAAYNYHNSKVRFTYERSHVPIKLAVIIVRFILSFMTWPAVNIISRSTVLWFLLTCRQD